MKIELITSGGVTGRGVGTVKIEGSDAVIDGTMTAELTDAEEARLACLPILRSTRSPHRTPDAIVYTLIVDGHRWTWSDVAAPPDFANWARTLLAIRERVIGQLPSSM
ncbi:MAG TPA: hypothetical protein VLV78_22390 [Thermoanaerobaculia bacterium]|nr:hypothetical protein [Thermoanaerobaculia bacterium]